MSALVDFLRRLLKDGQVVLREPLVIATPPSGEAIALLRQAYADHQLDLTGPPLDFCPEIALATAELVRQACWFLVHHGDPPDELQRRLQLPPPRQPADHLSADVILRFLPQVYQRARAMAPSDVLAGRLATVLRQWPLTGVLADLPEPPLTPIDFGGHPGLLMLYAERFARNEKTEWLPQGKALEYLEMVYHDLGRKPPGVPRPVRAQAGSEGDSDDGD